MKLSNQLQKVLNDQLNLELSSAYAYFGMAAYFEHTALTGFGAWMAVQAREELGHANRFFKYIVERGGRATLPPIAAAKCDYTSALDAFKTSLAHEQKVSASICAIYEQAGAEKDYPTLSFLKWFLDEQVEEERNVADMLAKLQLVGDNTSGLYQLDRQAAQRAAANDKS